MNIKKFFINDRFFIYDRNTNFILEVDEKVYNILDENMGFNSEIRHKVKTEKNLTETIKNIENIQNQYGCFKPFELKGFRFDEKMKKKHINRMVLNISEECNLRCKYCTYSGLYEGHRIHSNNFMDWRVAKRSIDFLLENYDEKEKIVLGFYGGEPLLNFDVIEKSVNYIKSKTKNIYFSITTNATLLKKKIVNFFVENDFQIFISLDGPRDLNDRYRVFKNNNGSFDIVYKNTLEIKNLYPKYYNRKVGFSVVIHPPYKCEEFYRFFTEDELVKNNIHLFSFVNPFGTTFYKNFTKDEINGYLPFWDNLRKKFVNMMVSEKYNDEIKILFELFGKNIYQIHLMPKGLVVEKYLHPGGICYPGYYKTFIGTDGRIYPCEKLGYVLEIGDIFEGVNNKRVNDIIDEFISIKEKLCKECWAVRLCNPCFLSAIEGNNFSFERKKEFCTMNKKIIEKNLETYIMIIMDNKNAFDNEKFKVRFTE